MGGMGGMYNVRDPLQRNRQRGFQAFDVKDELPADAKTTRANSNVKPAQKDQAAAKESVKSIQIEIREGADPNEVWEKYFSANDPEPAAVRDAVRRLIDNKEKAANNYAHAQALIEAAIRHGQAQPWMYEALVIVMTAGDRPKPEIERAIMSAAEFAQTPLDLMNLAIYMSDLGFDQRALQMYRQVSAMDPTRHEPFVLGLKIAEKIKDIEGMKWASLGILSQAWPKEQAKIWNSGIATANSVLDALKKEKRNEEAKQFEKALDDAVARDCVAVVQWTGDAEVDVIVEEPAGTSCSLRNPRTTSGGILIGDTASKFGGEGSEGHSQVYVCTKGFDGKYRILLRPVWGKVTAGKVTVDVCTHYRGEKPIFVTDKIPVNKNDAIVEFELKDGRRLEPIKEQQLANALAGQAAINRQILSQQLNALADPQAMGSLATSRLEQASLSNASFTPFVAGQIPFAAGKGAIGYEPQITTLPEGAQLSAQAVISADRRYVRVAPTPSFSGIAEVHTYNTSSGSTSTTTGIGTGGQGYSGTIGQTGGGTGFGSGGFGSGGFGGGGFGG
jgi:hypothetical protein